MGDMGVMRVLAVTEDGVETHPAAVVEALLADPGTLLWMDLLPYAISSARARN